MICTYIIIYREVPCTKQYLPLTFPFEVEFIGWRDLAYIFDQQVASGNLANLKLKDCVICNVGNDSPQSIINMVVLMTHLMLV